MEQEWRKFIIKQMNILSSHVSTPLYGIDHALDVEKAVVDIISSNKELITSIEFPIIISAALLHDIGFLPKGPKWSLDAFEHIQLSKEKASKILSMAPLFKDNPVLIDQVLLLIEHHEDTAYSFPTAVNHGRPLLGTQRIAQPIALKVLQEADSQTHAMGGCLARTLQSWERDGLPYCISQNKSVIPSWRWHDSIFSNTRLLGKRVILDSFTPIGKQRALEIYDDLEVELKGLCATIGVPYVTEACHPKSRQDSLERLASKRHKLEVIAFYGWNEMVETMRAITLQYDKSLHPYENAQIESQLVCLEKITPMALYVMKTRLNETLEFHDALMVNFCWNLWDLPGILEFRYNSDEDQKIAPPIVEVYKEIIYPEHPQLMGLLDGLHRCTVARKIDQKNIRAIVASGVPYPPEPLPVKWEQIKERLDKPSTKKSYRYGEWSNVPKEIKDEFKTISKENFQNFFYRDLSPIGSKGKRGFDEFKKKRV